MNQQGGYTIGTLNINQPPASTAPDDPFPNRTDEQVAQMAYEESKRISAMSDKCMKDKAEAAEREDARAWVSFVRHDYSRDVRQCCLRVLVQLHNSILIRMPSAVDASEEFYFQFDLFPPMPPKPGVPVLEYCDDYLREAKYVGELAKTLANRTPMK